MKPLLLLHGAMGSATQFQPLMHALSDSFVFHAFNFPGHGGVPVGENKFSIEGFAHALLRYMDENNLHQADIFGYSMGGYVATWLAAHHPDRVGKLATLATKFHWDAATAAKEIGMLNPERIQEKLPAFAQTLAGRHAPGDWKKLLGQTAELLQSLGNDRAMKPEDFQSITHKMLIMLGDRDRMVTREETMATYDLLRQGSLCILPDTAHPLEQADISLLAIMLRHHFNG